MDLQVSGFFLRHAFPRGADERMRSFRFVFHPPPCRQTGLLGPGHDAVHASSHSPGQGAWATKRSIWGSVRSSRCGFWSSRWTCTRGCTVSWWERFESIPISQKDTRTKKKVDGSGWQKAPKGWPFFFPTKGWWFSLHFHVVFFRMYSNYDESSETHPLALQHVSTVGSLMSHPSHWFPRSSQRCDADAQLQDTQWSRRMFLIDPKIRL